MTLGTDALRCQPGRNGNWWRNIGGGLDRMTFTETVGGDRTAGPMDVRALRQLREDPGAFE